MSDYEKINTRVKKQMSSRRKEALVKIIAVLVAVLVTFGALWGLTAIGFISRTFQVILVSITVCAGAFKTGYFWRDIQF